MTNLEALITNIELCSKADGCSTVTFPTLKKLSVDDVADLELDVPFPCFPDVVTIWSSVSKHVQRQLLQEKLSQVLFFNLQMLALLFFFQPRTVNITGLGTFHIKKWLSLENGEVLTFQRPLFSLSRTAAQILCFTAELQSSSYFPGEIKKVSVSSKKIHSDVPYSEEVVQNCMQETLNFFYFILTNREDTDFIFKDVGTLAIRGTDVTMAFCEDFLLSLNKSKYVVEKLLTKKWVISDKEVTVSPSCFGRVYQFPQFKIRAVPRKPSLTGKKIFTEFENALSSMGVRGNVCD
ncbi:CCD81 protein, partial [Sula dactylatra]|nr:CCD81 protein [Sula dactylatra]